MNIKITKTSVQKLEVRESMYEVRDTELKGFLVRVYPTNKKTFFFAYRNIIGKNCNYKIGSFLSEISVYDAREKAEALKVEVNHGGDPHKERRAVKLKRVESQEVTVRRFLEDIYLPEVLSKRKAGDATCMRIMGCFKKLLDTPISDLEEMHINWKKNLGTRGAKFFIEQRYNRHVCKRDKASEKKNLSITEFQELKEKSPATRNRDFGCLKAMFNYAVKERHLNENPLQNWAKAKEVKTITPRYFDKVGYKILMIALEDREEEKRTGRMRMNKWLLERNMPLHPSYKKLKYVDHFMPAVLLAVNTGMRKSEYLSLKWEYIDWKTSKITLPSKTTKSGEERSIPLNVHSNNILTELRKVRKSDIYVFSEDGKNHIKDIRRAWMNLRDRMKTITLDEDRIIEGLIDDDRELIANKVSTVRIHDLRHTCATMLLNKGASFEALRKILGHADISTTMIYAKITDQTVLDTVRLLD